MARLLLIRRLGCCRPPAVRPFHRPVLDDGRSSPSYAYFASSEYARLIMQMRNYPPHHHDASSSFQFQHANFATAPDHNDAIEETISNKDNNATSSIENDLVKAELAGMSGSDDAYEALVRDLDEALGRLEQVADNAADEDKLLDALQSAGKCYWNLGLLDEAREMFEDALSRMIVIHGDDSNSDSGSHDNTGQQPPNHPDIASILHTLGSIHARSGAGCSEATKWFESSLSMKRKVYGNRMYHPEIGKTLNSLAMLQVEEEDMDHAMRLFEEAERNYIYHGMDRGCGGRTGSVKTNNAGDNQDEARQKAKVDYANHPERAVICENMANLYRRSGDHKAALRKYQDALTIRMEDAKSSSGDNNGNAIAKVPDNVRLGLTLNIADCLRALSKWDEAAESYEAALQDHIRSRNANTNVTEEKEAGSNSWLPFSQNGPESDNAEEVRTALESVIRHNLGLIHAENGRFDLALEEYETSRKIKVALAGENHPEVAATLNAIGALYGSQGDPNRSLSYFRQALHIFRSHSAALGDDCPDVVNTLRNIQLIEKNRVTGQVDRLTK